jgi:ATPase subunit of ABC transporter with duplicated ATPase domains
MFHRYSPAAALADRFCRPQRIGVFGHRGVGKTTLLTMLYREAVHGRLPDLRLAAADARTADYLSGKIAQLENDLAMALEAQAVRIVAPIPGKAVVVVITEKE